MTVRWGLIGASTGEDGVWSLACAEAALESARSRRTIKIEPGLRR